jgi:hypothetical protein
MYRKFSFIIVLTLIGLSLCAGTTTAAKKSLEELSGEILTTLQAFYPVKATEMGIHSYDFLLTDYSNKSVKAMIKRLDRFERDLRNLRNAHAEDLTYLLLKSNVDMALLNLKEIAWHKKSPMIYVNDAVDGVYFLLLSGHAPMSEKRVAILSRMGAVPGMLTTARKMIKKPPPIYVEAALEALESGSLFYQRAAGQLMKEFPDEADHILKVSTRAREAMNDFSIHLTNIKLGDETSFAVGTKNFDYMLQHEHFLTIDSDSLLTIGLNLLAESQAAYAAYQVHMKNNPGAGRDSVFVPACITPEDILEYYQWETEQVRAYCGSSDFVSVPEDIGAVEVVETPPFLRTMIAGIAYQPAGPFDTVQKGYFYVRPIMRDMEREQIKARFRYVNRRGFRGSVVHEAYPGHHLQMQIAGQHPDPVRKWQQNNMMIEGWALYCEEAVYEHGLYGEEDPARWLGVLGGIRFRAARIVADVKLHTGQFTYEECVAWMIDVLEADSESSREYLRTNVRRYTMAPTMPMTYLMGKREVVRLRDATIARDGADFSLRAFHDALLQEGTIPPALMWKVLDLTQ